jgi:hypothetical protein
MGRKCAFCPKASWNTGTSIFELTDDVKKELGLHRAQWGNYRYVCADHYSPDDIIRGGDRNNVRKGAIPVRFEEPSSNKEHSYSMEGAAAESSEEDSPAIVSQVTSGESQKSKESSQSDQTYASGVDSGGHTFGYSHPMFW